MGLYDFTFYDLINRNAGCFSDKNAWYEVDDNQTLTFYQIKEEVDKLAFGLQNEGISKGDRIGILGKNCLEFFLLFGAASALGAIILPINWRLSADEVAFNVNDCEPKILFVGKEFQETIKSIKDKILCVKKYYNLKQKDGDFMGFDTLMNNKGAFLEEQVASDDGFVIIHTAAVEGRPRGALLSHNNIMCGNMHFNYLFDLRPHDVHLNVLPLFHAGGLFMVTTTFHAGTLNINTSSFDATQALDLIETNKVSILMEFSPMLTSILEEQEKTGKDISTLCSVAGIDSPDTIEKYQQMVGGQFYCLYGQTETSCLATFGAYNDKPGSAGKVIQLADVKLVDDYDQPVPKGQIGEILVKGPMIFKGYWNLKEDTEYTFRDGWHHTGDLGSFDKDNFLWYAGRKPEKELIKPGGENVYPAEVEKVILQHPAVERTVVFGVPDPKWKEGIKAVCQLKEGETLDARDLIEFVGGRIARFKKPQYVEFVEDIPLRDDGLPDRNKVKDQYRGSK
ncbi:AMP-binding protein [Thermodesulfobacteriota bacterium]